MIRHTDDATSYMKYGIPNGCRGGGKQKREHLKNWKARIKLGFKTSQTLLGRAEYQAKESQLRDCCLKLCIPMWHYLLIKQIIHSKKSYTEISRASFCMPTDFTVLVVPVISHDCANCLVLGYTKNFVFHPQLWRLTPCYIVQSTCIFLPDADLL